MSLKVIDIMKIIDGYAPVSLKESYDNVGLMVGDSNEIITSILVSLDCTLEVIEEAITKKCNLILTHHPLLFNKPTTITNDTLLGKKIIKLIKNNINVYSSHTNLDMTLGGVNDIITEVLGYDEWKIIEQSNCSLDTDDKLGIGRLVELKESISLSDLCDKVKKKLCVEHLRYSGSDSLLVNRIAIINGSGQDYFYNSVKLGANCIITGDTSYHNVSELEEQNIAVIDAGHFDTEWPAIKILSNKLADKIKNLGYNNKIYISEVCKSPYKIK